MQTISHQLEMLIKLEDNRQRGIKIILLIHYNGDNHCNNFVIILMQNIL